MVFRRYFSRSMALVMISSVLLGTVSCKKTESVFPEIPAPSTSDTTEETVPAESVSETTQAEDHLTVALPYDNETVEYLYKLYCAKNSGIWNDNLSGDSIDLAYLDSVSTDIKLETIYVPSEGVSVATIETWGDDIPDIFLTNDFKRTKDSGYCAAIDDYLYDNDLMTANNIYVCTLEECMADGDLYGVPFYCSVPLIYGNEDFAPSSGALDFRCSFDDFDRYLTKISERNEDIPVFTKAYQLIPYLGSAFNNIEKTSRSYMLSSEYDSNKDVARNTFDEILEYVQALYDNGLATDSDEQGADPVYSRNSALWIAQSTELDLWNSYYPNKLYFTQIPVFKDTDTVVPYLTLYPLCIDSGSDCKQLASDFAAFIALDKDAVLLRDRLEHKTGLLPVISSDQVWDQLISDSKFGYMASVYESRMKDAKFSFKVLDNELNDKIEIALSEHFKQTDEDRQELRLDQFYG